MFGSSLLTLYDPYNLSFKLTVPSTVFKYDFLDCFNELLPILQFYAIKEPFQVESETPNYISTTQGESWRPWHHIYALCKAGKGQTHKPLYCPYGKYVLRLYYMGTWRKFVVDDTIPCDKMGQSMLPITQVPGEIWPILLTKGLFKVLQLTFDQNGSVFDFPLLTFFTGWVYEYIPIQSKTPDQIWRRIQALTTHYETPDDSESKVSPNSRSKDSTKKTSSKKEPIKGSTASPNTETYCHILVTLGNFQNDCKHLDDSKVFVTMNRDSPLVKVGKREETKRWKRFRWIYWASEKGIWKDERLLPPYRRVKYISFLKYLKQALAPDPKQEAILYDLPQEEIEDSWDDCFSASGDSAFFEPEQWADFYRLYEHLLDINGLFRIGCFDYSYMISSLKSEKQGKETATPATAKTTANPERTNYFFNPPDLTPTLNKPPFLFCESVEPIVIIISLSVYPIKGKQLFGYLDPNQPDLLKIGHASFALEKLDWKSVDHGEVLGFMKTVGTSSVLVNLKPGRHILKIWVNSDSPYSLNLWSNTTLNVSKGSKTRFLMTFECERILKYIDKVSDAFIALTLKYGKPEFSKSLREFYDTLKPGNDLAIGYYSKLDNFIDLFLNCIMLAVKSVTPNIDELRVMQSALRSLFLNLKIDCELPSGPAVFLFGPAAKKAVKKVVVVVRERTLSEIMAYPWTVREIEKIILVQRIFRGYRVRLLFKYQIPTRKEFKTFQEKFKKICDLIFSPTKRELEVGKIIRKVIIVNPEMCNMYKFWEDFTNVIHMDEYTGKVPNVEPHSWVPFARFIIACHSDVPLPSTLCFSCNLEQFVTMAVDNDTNEELFSVTNASWTHFYQKNSKGYTIFIFGWNSGTTKTVYWKLEMVRMKHFQVIHLCNTMSGMSCQPYSMPTIEVLEIKNFYVPNHKKKICKCFIKVQRRSVLSLRLSTSYPECQFMVQISIDKRFCSLNTESIKIEDQIITSCLSANGVVFIPALILENIPANPWWGEVEDESTLYYLEAYVLQDSWPLSKKEWGVVETIRVNGEAWKDSLTNLSIKKSRSDSRKKSTRMSKRSLQDKPVENPFWTLQVVNDSSNVDPSEAMIIEEDKTYQESVKAMKHSWEEKHPGRRKKGRELRLNFLYAMYIEDKMESAEEEGFYENSNDTGRDDSSNDKEFKDLIYKMTDFTYLTRSLSPTRLNASPRYIPRMPTKAIINRHKHTNQKTEDNDVECASSEVSDCIARNISESIEDDRREYLNMRIHFRLVLVNYLAVEQNLSNQLMDQAYKQRSKAIQRMAG